MHGQFHADHLGNGLAFVAGRLGFTQFLELYEQFLGSDMKGPLPAHMGCGVGCTWPGLGGLLRGCTGSGGGALGSVAMDVFIFCKRPLEPMFARRV